MEDVLTEMTQKEGYVSEVDNGITVVLDTHLTEELIEEGNVREIISKIQTMRKEADFNVTDKINVSVNNNERIEAIIMANAEEIKENVLAESIVIGSTKGFTKEWNINGEEVIFAVENISSK